MLYHTRRTETKSFWKSQMQMMMGQLTARIISMEQALRRCQACNTSRAVSCSATSWTTQVLPKSNTRRFSTCAAWSLSPSIWKAGPVRLSVYTTAWQAVWSACWPSEFIEERLANSWWTHLASSRTRPVPCPRRYTRIRVARIWWTKTSYLSLMSFKESSWSTELSRNRARMRMPR